ncbi:MAG: lysophospholipid acyltransferase family protein [Gammaproteobacteria bacterium]
MALITSTLFSLSMILLTIVFSLLGILLYPLPPPAHYRVMRLYAVLNIKVLQYLCGIRYEVEGLENIPAGPAIIFCKHQSTWETMALQQFFPAHSFIVKRELLWLPFFGWGLASMRPVAINRGSGRKAINQLLSKGKKLLASGRWLAIFPEGTRVAAGQRGRYKIGGAILAAESGYPVVPVAHNAGEFWPRGGFIKRPGTVRLVIGPLIVSQGRKAEDILADAERWIETTMQRISNVTYPPYQDRTEKAPPA